MGEVVMTGLSINLCSGAGGPWEIQPLPAPSDAQQKCIFYATPG